MAIFLVELAVHDKDKTATIGTVSDNEESAITDAIEYAKSEGMEPTKAVRILDMGEKLPKDGLPAITSQFMEGKIGKSLVPAKPKRAKPAAKRTPKTTSPASSM